MGRNDEDWAVFWCSLLSPLVLGEIPEREREPYFRKLSAEERLLPNGRRGHVSVRTLRRKWKRLCDEKVAGLFRRPRADRGKPRKAHAKLLARAVELKKEQPYRSDKVINRILKKQFGRQVPRSTLYRHLRREGVTRRKLGISKEPIRCRWTRQRANALWEGDFEHGPLVIHQGHVVKTHLSAWIDCHSRYIVGARYYIRENLDILIDSLLRAWGDHGASRELYVDNGKVYHAKALTLACTQLNIKLLHRPVRDPAPGGLIERFFGTAQTQLEAEIRASQTLSLDELNRLLVAWLETAYHREEHSETGKKPYEHYYEASRFTRHVDLNTVLTFFHKHEKRKVDEDFVDVRIANRFFKADIKLRGDEVVVEYDPFGGLEEVRLYSLTGTYLGVARRYEREKGSHPEVEKTEPDGPITPHYLDALRSDYDALHEQQRAMGIDYHSAQQSNAWSFTSFAGAFARLLGRKGAASALTPDEMQVLGDFHARHDRLNERLLRQAFDDAESPSIRHVLFHLQELLGKRNDD